MICQSSNSGVVGNAQNLIAIIKTLVDNDVLISMNVMISILNKGKGIARE